jgi:glucokinase
MDPVTWSNSERKIARQAFDTALSREEASLLADFKARAAAAAWAGSTDSVTRN